jgi:hypothetical protein
MNKLLVSLVLFLSIVSCSSSTEKNIYQEYNSKIENEAKSYQISQLFIHGESEIQNFTIAELTGGKNSEEKQRICCFSTDDKFSNKICFNQKNTGYKWNYCTLDLRFIEDDSLKDLTLEEKLEILNSESTGKEFPDLDICPIDFEPGKWYHFFGLPNIEGSYFVHVEEDEKFTVEYFSGGP